MNWNDSPHPPVSPDSPAISTPAPAQQLPPPAPHPSIDPIGRAGGAEGQRRRSRFGSGVAVGVALSAAAAGGFVLGGRDDTTATPSTAAPAASEQVASDAPQGDLASLSTVGDIVEQVRPSIVAIHQTLSQTDRTGTVRTGESAGTGFVLSADGYIVTNSHVVAEGDATTVDFDDGTSISAEIVAASPEYDLAVLKVDRDDLVPLPIGASGDLRIGDELVAVGYALDLDGEPSVTTGILSATDRSLSVTDTERLVNLLQTDTAINPGNSGGPLLNASGEVIGINTAIAGQAQNIGFSIAIDEAWPLLDDLRNGVVPEVALLGVSSQPSTGQVGAEIVDVVAGSAADGAGVEVGDVITMIAGEPIDGPDELGVEIAEQRPGDQVDISVIRNGEQVELSAVLGSRSS